MIVLIAIIAESLQIYVDVLLTGFIVIAVIMAFHRFGRFSRFHHFRHLTITIT